MPRYFFHVHDGLPRCDDEGIEFADNAAARRAATEGARAMICDQVRAGRLALQHRIEVEDESGAPLMTLAFADAVTIETLP